MTNGAKTNGGAHRQGHLQAIDDMRGLAILAIVLLHAANAVLNRGLVHPLAPSTRLIAAANDILFHNSTIYFALISGILYGHLFAARPHGAFLRARLANVGSPYLVMTAGLTAILWFAASKPVAGLPAGIVRNLILGDAWNTFWYIPVILILYALSPLLWRVMTDRRLGALALLLLVQPLLFTRTDTELTPQMFAYYAGVYCCGMLVGADVPRALDWLRREAGLVRVVAGVSAIVLALLHAADLDRIGFTSLRESVFYIFRLSIAGLVLPALVGWGLPVDRQPRKLLGLIAAASFGIYFLHGPLLRPIARTIGPMVPTGQPAWAVLLAILLSALAALFLCLLILLPLKRLLGRRSRYLTGY
ncbi:acyltransferase family protein [Sandaracinobacter sp.]|uniref:acyltransferase family protein n=1 Tax=Sandaracinobacter sp. TaxID=2487581 RepID=UPI0035B2CCDD